MKTTIKTEAPNYPVALKHVYFSEQNSKQHILSTQIFKSFFLVTDEVYTPAMKDEFS